MSDPHHVALRVTVVLPTHNRAHLVRAAIATVQAQTVPDWELVVVDDASQDETPTVLAALAAADPRIRVIRTRRPSGASGARNVGIRAARGAFVAFIDDDCQWSPVFLARQLAACADPGVGLAYCQMRLTGFDGSAQVIGVPDAAQNARAALLRRCFIGPAMVLVRRALLVEAQGFDEALPVMEDWDLWLRLAARTRFAFTQDALVTSTLQPGGLTSRVATWVETVPRFLANVRARGATDAELADVEGVIGHVLLVGGASEPGRRLLRDAARRSRSPRLRILAALACSGPLYRTVIRARERAQGTWVDRVVARFWQVA